MRRIQKHFRFHVFHVKGGNKERVQENTVSLQLKLQFETIIYGHTHSAWFKNYKIEW